VSDEENQDDEDITQATATGTNNVKKNTKKNATKKK